MAKAQSWSAPLRPAEAERFHPEKSPSSPREIAPSTDYPQ
jgi:hypothetical protein